MHCGLQTSLKSWNHGVAEGDRGLADAPIVHTCRRACVSTYGQTAHAHTCTLQTDLVLDFETSLKSWNREVAQRGIVDLQKGIVWRGASTGAYPHGSRGANHTRGSPIGRCIGHFPLPVRTTRQPQERRGLAHKSGLTVLTVDWVDRLDHLCAARKAELTKLLAATSDETSGLRCNGKLSFVELSNVKNSTVDLATSINCQLPRLNKGERGSQRAHSPTHNALEAGLSRAPRGAAPSARPLAGARARPGACC